MLHLIGGDGPEAVADALDEVRQLEWREKACKICVFIADAPPHGLGDKNSGDGFPDGLYMHSLINHYLRKQQNI